MIQSLADRFWGNPVHPKIDYTGNPIGCWVWIAMTDSGGRRQFPYGVIRVNNKRLKAHRVAWELTNGPIPEGLCVLHKCDNPPCVNPSHLFLGTKGDNFADAVQKGRLELSHTAEEQGLHKLTWVEVREIRSKYERGGQTYKSLGKEYGVC